ncbi:MAG: T9SS type B sorting domain-containing protein, partial [Paludibacteraceae bacterium]|nr:T9SS type B sorting domain-containing protein [Paludibacteraceae bacterium]
KKFDKKSWKPIPGSDITTEITYDKLKDLFVGKDPDEKIYFRVILGSQETFNSFGLNYPYNPDDACASYTVSAPIEVTVKCDACTEPADIIKIKSDKKATGKKNKKDVIELCYGESVTLSQAADITPDKADWASADFEGFAIKWFEAEKPGDMLGAKSVLNDKISPKVVQYDDVSLGGTEMPVVLFAVDALYLDGKCKTGDTVYIKFNPVPDAAFSDSSKKFCEGEGTGLFDMRLNKGDLSDYTVRWWGNSDTLTSSLGEDLKEEFFEGLKSDEGGVFYYQLVDNKTGCKGGLHEYEVIVNPIPDAPKDEKIQYTINGNSNETMTTDKFAQTIDKTMDLVWFQSKTEPSSQGKKSVQIDRSVATTTPYVFYIAYKDPVGGCYSERAEVTVEVLAAPTPSVKDIDLCKDGTYDALEGIVASDEPAYELIWFKSKSDTAGKALTSAPTDVVDVTKPGKYTLYVAQRATTAPYAQSEVVSFDVTVYDVKEPVDASRHEYCANEPAEELKANMEKDEANYFYADEIVFVSGVDEQPTFIPDTKKQTSQKYEYQAYQKFTTPESKRECKGPSIDIQVDVIAVEKPKVNHSVSYVKSEAAATQEFVDILVKSPDAIENVADQTLLWSKKETGNYVKGSTPSSKPDYDDSVPVGQVEKQERWVKWEATTAAGLTCQSEPEKIDITISSTPAPIVKKIEICEEVFKGGSIPTDKEPGGNAEVNDNGKKLPDYEKYELVWFDNQADADESMTDPSKLSSGSKTAPTLSAAFSGVDMSDETVSEWTKSLYVVQTYDDGAGNVTTSPASEMKLVVNATPKLKEIAHAPVCKGPVNLTDNKYWNVSNGVTVEAEYSYEGSSVTQNASGLTKAGKYTIVGTSSLGCKSEELDLQLDIRNLSIEMDPRSETCPGDNVEQEVRIDFSYNHDGKEATDNKVKLSWESEENTSDKLTNAGKLNGPDETSFDYISGNFEGKAGDTHTITVTMTDGYCTATTKQTVEIGNGPAGGTFTWIETDNESTENGSKIPLTDSNKDDIQINACGGPVTVDFGNVTMDAGSDVEWFKTSDYSSAPYKTDVAPTFSYNDYGTYYVRYMNNCYAYAKVTINDASVKIKTDSDNDKVFCENQEYKINIDVDGPAGKTRQWYKDGDFYANNSDGLSFSPLKKKDQGSYKVEYRYDGCRAELDVVDLKVKEYVKVDVDGYEMYEGKKSFIVPAGENFEIAYKFTVPSEEKDINSLIMSADEYVVIGDGLWGSCAQGFAVYSINQDIFVHAKVESDDYCPGEVEFQVLRDAKLVLNAELDTKMCLNEEKPFTIDTIGTGAFRRPGAKLEITATPENGTATQEKGFNVVLDTLKKNVSPRVTTTYDVTFTYQGQKLDTSITVVVYNFKVEPVNEVICSGEEISLKATVTPADSKIEWFDEDKTTSLGEGDGILVSPKFDGPVSAQKSQHKYWARPFSDLVTCTSSGMTPLLVDVYRPLEGDIEDKTICEGDDVRIDAGSYGATTYTWTVNGETVKGSRYYQDKPTETTKYQVHMTRGNVCEADDEATVTVTTNPVIASIDSVGYRDVDIVMDPSFGTPSFRYSIDGGEWTENTHLTGLKYTAHTIKVEDANGCTLLDTFVVKDPAIVFPNWFSPNKDGEFDHWTVPGIQETYPEAEFTIYDRWGKKLVEFKGADDGWDGSYNGVAMPSTDYWYECLIREIDKVYKGHFTLIRR